MITTHIDVLSKTTIISHKRVKYIRHRFELNIKSNVDSKNGNVTY